MLLVAVSVLGLAMVILAMAVRKVSNSLSPALQHDRYRTVAAAASDLDDAVGEFRAAVDGRADR